MKKKWKCTFATFLDTGHVYFVILCEVLEIHEQINHDTKHTSKCVVFIVCFACQEYKSPAEGAIIV